MTVPAGTLADTIAQAIGQGSSQAIKDNIPAIQAAMDEAAGSVKTDPFAGVGNLSDVLANLTNVVETLLGAVDPIKDLEGIAGNAGKSFGIGYLLGFLGWQLGQPFFNTFIQDAYKIAVDLGIETQLDPATTAKLVVDGILTQNEGFAEGQRQGYDNGRMGHLFEDAKTRPDVMVLMDLLNRKAITQADVDYALTRHGYDSFWVTALNVLAQQLLSPADLALASLRGIIDQATLDTYSAKLGVSSDDMQVLIGNTGEPPGLMQLLEAYRRGFIDQATLEKGIRQSRVRNEWIPTVEKLRYTPMSVADAARSVVQNHMTAEEGASIAQQNGLEPDHWPILVEDYGRPLSHEQMMALYHRGLATREQVDQAFRESDIKDKYIEGAFLLGERLPPERTIVSMIDHGVITHDEGIKLLMEQGFSEANAGRLVNLGAAQRLTSHKTLSKADTLSMYEDALITRAQAVDHLKTIGYSEADANQMIDLADYKRKAAVLKTTERGIEAELKAHNIDAKHAIERLVQAGLDMAQAQLLVDEWTQQRRISTRTLTEAQIIKATKANLISVENARTRLLAYGLPDGDITILFQLDGVLPAPGG